MVFTFTLNYELTSDESDMDALVECMAEEGCDDALVGVGQPGQLALEFIREAVRLRHCRVRADQVSLV